MKETRPFTFKSLSVSLHRGKPFFNSVENVRITEHMSLFDFHVFSFPSLASLWFNPCDEI